jgi:dCTP deaminase
MSGFWNSEGMQDRLPDLIDPFDAASVVNCAYELRMGPEAYVTQSETTTKRELQLGEQIPIPPGQFAMLLTEEQVTMPPTALGLISVKFGLKQRGLVNVSGFHVDPGFRGRLLFSVYNAGPNDIVIARGDAAFLLWYASLESETTNTYGGRRRDQMSISSGDVMTLLGDVASPQALSQRLQRLEHRLEMQTRLVWLLVGVIVTAAVGVVIAALS